MDRKCKSLVIDPPGVRNPIQTGFYRGQAVVQVMRPLVGRDKLDVQVDWPLLWEHPLRLPRQHKTREAVAFLGA
jgi:hypothetical protein